MALGRAELELLKSLYAKLDPIVPLEPGDPRYEPVYSDESAHREDPVSRLRTQIDWSEGESLHLFSGFRGSGKTTELKRLAADLEEAGYCVLYANALNYLNPAEPVEISDLLMVVAGAFSDGLEQKLGTDGLAESFWKRITHYLKTTCVSVTEATAKVEVDSPAKDILGGLSGGIELKLALKEASSFKQRLQQFLQNRLPELQRQVRAFIEEGVQRLRATLGPTCQVVFIFDQLEQLQGSTTTDQVIIESVARLFGAHLDKLRLPYLHAVYTVPPWLSLPLPGLGAEILPSLQLLKKGDRRERNDQGWASLRSLVFRRFGAAAFAAVFGAEPGRKDHPLADRIIEASGGYFRDLFRILRELLIRIQTRNQTLAATETLVEGAIQRVREQYLPLTLEDAQRLQQVAATQSFNPPRATAEEIARASRLLNLHLVFYY